MQEDHWKKLQICLSKDRLAAYGHDGVTHRVITARYLWNIALCEALYAPLQMCEVGLRNAIDQAMLKITDQPNWFDTITLTSWGYVQVGKAKQKIAGSGKDVTSGRVIAELSFGFWTSMFEDHYEKHPGARFLPDGIKLTFPNLPKSQHQRKTIKARLEKIRRLRNRIFHHERIIHWKDLPQQHQAILDTLVWINSDLGEITRLVDIFTKAHADGIQPFLDKLDGHLTSEGTT